MPDDLPNGNPFAGLPTWLKAVAAVGFPAAVAGVLLYFLLGLFNIQSDAHMKEATAHFTHMQTFMADHSRAQTDTLSVLQGMCLNAARTIEQQQRCLVK